MLTPKQTRVLRLLAAGETRNAAAEKLKISKKTLDIHISCIKNTLKFNSGCIIVDWVLMTHYAIRIGLVKLKTEDELGINP